MFNNILITDDSVFDNAILKNYLHNEKFNVISAQNGRDALEMIESRNIDLIILDLIMPVLDGFEFLKIFSKTSYYEEIPIIITSSLCDEKTINNILQYNIFDFLIKPFDNSRRNIFVNKIRTALAYRNLKIELNKYKHLVDSKKEDN